MTVSVVVVTAALVMLMITMTTTSTGKENDLVACLLNVPAICECISGTDLLNFTCCHTETEVADQIVHLTQSQYPDTWPTTGMTRPRKNLSASEIQTRDLPLPRRTP